MDYQEHAAEVTAALKPTSTPKDVLQEIVRLAEARLQGQLTAALAADLKAVTFLGFDLALLAFVIGAAITAATGDHLSLPLAHIAFLGAGGLFLSCVVAFLAARPAKFEMAGNRPDSFRDDVLRGVGGPTVADQAVRLSLAEQAGLYDSQILANRDSMKWSARLLMAAVVVAAVTLVACAYSAYPIIWSACVSKCA